MNKYSLIFSVLLLMASCSTSSSGEHHIEISTGYGDIEVELFPKKAPKTVAAFLSYVDEGLYEEASFYRVLKNDNVPEEYNTGLIQGGIINTNLKKHLQLKGIEHESPRTTGISHISGTISLARTTLGSASSEFFICIGDQKQFDSSGIGNYDGFGYAAFGRVVKGMDIVSKIQNRKSKDDHFVNEIKIRNIKRL